MIVDHASPHFLQIQLLGEEENYEGINKSEWLVPEVYF